MPVVDVVGGNGAAAPVVGSVAAGTGCRRRLRTTSAAMARTIAAMTPRAIRP